MNLLRKVWPEWEIVEKIGEGSFGNVYKVVRNDTGKDFYAALKILDIPKDFSEYNGIKADGLDDESAGTFFKELTDECLNEIKIMYSLKGTDNIVSIEDYKVMEQCDEKGRKQYHIFIRMELLQNLGEYIENNISGKDKETVCTEAVKIGTDLCSALELCSKANIIHRDIKMQNVFVSSFGKFKLGDFNISKHLEDRTSAMSRKGTMGYLAPEVYNGDSYTASVDIYSLGMLLYRILHNNRAPFLDAGMPVRPGALETAVSRRLSGEKIEPPANATPELAAVVLKALEYEPSARYASATEFKEALLNVGAKKQVYAVAAVPAADTSASQPAVPAPATEPKSTPAANAKQSVENVTVESKKSSNKFVAVLVCILVIAIIALTVGLIVALNGSDDDGNSSNDSSASIDADYYDSDDKETGEESEPEFTRASVTEPSGETNMDAIPQETTRKDSIPLDTTNKDSIPLGTENGDPTTSENKTGTAIGNDTVTESTGIVTITKEENKEFKITYTSYADKGVKLVPECDSNDYKYYDGSGASSFRMGGIEYTEGFTINKYVNSVTYKLDGKYTNMHFICGKTDDVTGSDTKVVAHLDGKEKDILYHADYVHLPEEVNIDVTGVNEITLSLAYGSKFGFGDIYFYDDGTVPPASVYTSSAPADKADLHEDIKIICGEDYRSYTGEPNKNGVIPTFTMIEKEYDKGLVLDGDSEDRYNGTRITFSMRGSDYTNLHFVCGKLDGEQYNAIDLCVELDGERQIIDNLEAGKYGPPIEYDIDITGAEMVSITAYTPASTLNVISLGITDFYFYNKNLYQKPAVQLEEAVPYVNPAYIWEDIEPFEIDSYCDKYNNYLDKKLSIAGVDYDLGVEMEFGGYMVFNCGRKYNKLHFSCGRLTSSTSDGNIQLKAVIDGEEVIIDNFNKGETDIREYDIDITGAEVVKIYAVFNTGAAFGHIGFTDFYFCNTNYPMDTQ